jgi:hypothetical protein
MLFVEIFAGRRGQYHLRQVFVFLNVFPVNQPEVMIGNAAQRFDAEGKLTDETAKKLIRHAAAASGGLDAAGYRRGDGVAPLSPRLYRGLLIALGGGAGTPPRQPPGRRRYFTSQHLYAFHVDGIAFDMSGDGHVMAFMSLECVLVVNCQDFVVAVGDDDRGGTTLDAFLGAGGCAGVGALGSALGVADPAIYGLGLAHVIG